MTDSTNSKNQNNSQDMNCTDLHKFNFTNELIAGGAAGAIASIAIAPMDLIRTMRQFDRESKLKHTSNISILKKLRAENGWKYWYKGLKTSLLGYVASWAIYFTIYSYLKKVLMESNFDDFSRNIISSVTSGFVTSTVTSPLWVINTKAIIGPEDRILAIIKNTYEEDGIGAFFRGLMASYLGLINVAIQYPLYEHLKAENFVQQIFDRDIKWFNTLCCSIISKCVSTLITYPHEVIRTRLVTIKQEDGDSYSFIQMVFIIFKLEGFLGFYKGMSITLARVIPYTAIIFTFHNIFLMILEQRI